MADPRTKQSSGFRRVLRALRTGSHLRFFIGRSVAEEQRQIAERGRCDDLHASEFCGRAKEHAPPHVGPTKSWALVVAGAGAPLDWSGLTGVLEGLTFLGLVVGAVAWGVMMVTSFRVLRVHEGVEPGDAPRLLATAESATTVAGWAAFLSVLGAVAWAIVFLLTGGMV